MQHFFQVSRIVIYASFYGFLGTKRCSKYNCVALRCVLKSSIKQRKWFSCLQYKVLLNSYSKGLILTNFRRRMDRHLRGTLSISRDETAFYICLRHVTMRPQVHHRTVIMVFLSLIYNSSQFALKRSNIDYFSRSRRSSFTRRFGYCLGRNGAANTFAQRHNVSSQFQRTVLTVFMTLR